MLGRCCADALPVLPRSSIGAPPLLRRCAAGPSPVVSWWSTSVSPLLRWYSASVLPVLCWWSAGAPPLLRQCSTIATPVPRRCSTVAPPGIRRFSAGVHAAPKIGHLCITFCAEWGGGYTRSLSNFAKIGPKLMRGLIHEGGLYTPKYGKSINIIFLGLKWVFSTRIPNLTIFAVNGGILKNPSKFRDFFVRNGIILSLITLAPCSDELWRLPSNSIEHHRTLPSSAKFRRAPLNFFSKISN